MLFSQMNLPSSLATPIRISPFSTKNYQCIDEFKISFNLCELIQKSILQIASAFNALRNLAQIFVEMLNKLRKINYIRIVVPSNPLKSMMNYTNNSTSVLYFIYPFSTHKKIMKEVQLQAKNMEEKAIVAFYTYDFITRSNSKEFFQVCGSLRSRIYNLEHLTDSLLKKTQSLLNRGPNSPCPHHEVGKLGQLTREQAYLRLQKVGFNRSNIDEVINAYNFNQGIEINLKVWKQQRYLQALSKNGKMILQPNFGTGLIFKKITSEIHQSSIITGDKGSGKSFAYLNYFYLSNYMIDFRIYLKQNKHLGTSHSPRFYQLVDKSTFQKIKKTFYLPLRHIHNHQTLQRIFQQQTHLANQNKVVAQSNKFRKQEQIRLFLSQIQYYFSGYDVQTACIVDEANAYFSFIRAFTYDNSSMSIFVQQYSSLLNCVSNTFNLLIYNSGQAFETQLLRNSTQSKTNSAGQPYHNVYNNNKSDTQNMHISYSQQLSYRQGHVYYYQILWDELCKQLPPLQNSTAIKKIFNQTFGLPSSKNGSEQPILKWWRSDIKHLNIRLVCHHKGLINFLQNYIDPLINLTEQQVLKNKHFLQKLFFIIQEQILANRHQIFLHSASGYISKAAPQIKAFRFAALHKIQQMEKIMNFRQQDLPIVQVDFISIIQQFEKIYPMTSFRQEASNMISLLECGFQTPLNNSSSRQNQIKNWNSITYPCTKFKFLIDKETLDQITSIIALKQGDILVLTDRLLNLQNIQSGLVGKLLDLLYFLVFQYSTIKFKILQKTQPPSERIYQVQKVFPFDVRTGRAKLEFDKQFQRMIQYVILHSNQYVLGFQATVYDKPNVLYPKGYRFNARNPIFDFVIIKKSGERLIIESFDTTLGKITSKVIQFFKKASKLAEQIKILNKVYKLNIIWKHRILAYQFLINQYYNTNHTSNVFKHKAFKSGTQIISSQAFKQEVMKTSNQIKYDGQKKQDIAQQTLGLLENLEIDEEVGELRIGLAAIPSQHHFVLPADQTKSQIGLTRQMMKLSQNLQKVSFQENEKV